MEVLKQVAAGLAFWLIFGLLALGAIATIPVAIALFALNIGNLRDWVYRTGKALDEVGNAAWFGGLPQETISSHTGRYIQSGKPLPFMFRLVVWVTDLFEKNHCVKAIEEPFLKEEL